MSLSRRCVLGMGGGLLAALSLPPVGARAGNVVEIAMAGRPDGSHVWFDPAGILIEPGQTIRWINRDEGNSHTATAYHPSSERPRRMPEAAEPWDSDYLLPGEAFSVTLTVPGVYDYYCLPHELAGMVGRIVVGGPQPASWLDDAGAEAGIPKIALAAFPTVAEIMEKRVVRRS